MPVIIRGRRVRFETEGPQQELPRWEPPPEPCDFCGKDRRTHPRVKGFGTSIDSSVELARNILADVPRDEHCWYTGLWSLAAHHLICGEAMDDEFWCEVCSEFAYSINHRNNGVMLPHDMALACQLGVPVHRGSHSAGHADEPDLTYPDGVKLKLDRVKDQIQAGQFCMNPATLRAVLDALSHEILQEVSAFRWTLTWDGEEYALGSAGCGGFKSIQVRRDAAERGRNPGCPHQRKHGLRHARTGATLPPNAQPLEIGT